MLPCNQVMNLLVKSCLAHAQSLYPVRICCYLVEATHIHIVLVVDNPENIVRFMERFKTESAHRINKLLGRRKRTVWCEGYDSPPLLTHTTVIEKIIYIYSNPSKDNLEDSIENYPGLSSWKAFRAGIHEIKVPYIRRPSIEKLPKGKLTINAFKAIARILVRGAKESHIFKVEPDAWMECFGIVDKKECLAINAEIAERLKEIEEEYRLKRKEEKRTVIGREKLLSGSLDPTYVPDRKGKRMWCHSDDPIIRKTFIGWLKSQIAEAREAYEAWSQGDFSIQFPVGFFPPSSPRTANLQPHAVCC